MSSVQLLSGAYSSKIKEKEKEHLDELKEKDQAEKSKSAERIQKLCRLTNRRRKAHELKRKVVQIKEAQYREEVLAKRKQQLFEITQRFQRQPVAKIYKATDELDYLTRKFANDPPILEEALRAIGSNLTNSKKQKPIELSCEKNSKKNLQGVKEKNKAIENSVIYHLNSLPMPEYYQQYHQKLTERQQKIMLDQQDMLQQFILAINEERQSLSEEQTTMQEIKKIKDIGRDLSELEKKERDNKLKEYHQKLTELKKKMSASRQIQQQYALYQPLKDSDERSSSSVMSTDSLEEAQLPTKSLHLVKEAIQKSLPQDTQTSSQIQNSPCVNSPCEKSKSLSKLVPQRPTLNTHLNKSAEFPSPKLNCVTFRNSSAKKNKEFLISPKENCNYTIEHYQKIRPEHIRGILKTSPIFNKSCQVSNKTANISNNCNSLINGNQMPCEETIQDENLSKKQAVRFALIDQNVGGEYNSSLKNKDLLEIRTGCDVEHSNVLINNKLNQSDEIISPVLQDTISQQLQDLNNSPSETHQIIALKGNFTNTAHIKRPDTKYFPQVDFQNLITTKSSKITEISAEELTNNNPQILSQETTNTQYQSEITVVQTGLPVTNNLKNYHCKDIRLKNSGNHMIVKNETLIQNKKQETSIKSIKKHKLQNANKNEAMENKDCIEMHPLNEEMSQIWQNLCSCLETKMPLTKESSPKSSHVSAQNPLSKNLKIRPSSAYKKYVTNQDTQERKKSVETRKKISVNSSKACNCIKNNAAIKAVEILKSAKVPPQCKSPTFIVKLDESSCPRVKSLQDRRYGIQRKIEMNFPTLSNIQEVTNSTKDFIAAEDLIGRGLTIDEVNKVLNQDTPRPKLNINRYNLSAEEARLMKSLERLDKQLKATEANYRVLKQEAEKIQILEFHILRNV